MSRQCRLLRFALAHGFEARIAGAGIVVCIPWSRVETRETGVEPIRCESMAELRRALGY